MQKFDLCAFYEGISQRDDLWLFSQFIAKQTISEDRLFEAVSSIYNAKVASFTDSLELLERVLMFIVIVKSDARRYNRSRTKLLAFLERLNRLDLICEHKLQDTLLALCFSLLNKPSSLHESINEEQEIVDKLKTALSSLFLGIVLNKESHIKYAYGEGLALLPLVREHGISYATFQEEKDYEPGLVDSLFYLLFDLLSKITGSSQFQKGLDHIQEEIHPTKESMVYCVLYESLLKEISSEISVENIESDHSRILSHGRNDLLFTSYLGKKHVGLGSISKKKAKIVTFGPHFYPLGQIERFGIFDDQMRQCAVDKRNDGFSRWCRLVSPDEYDVYGSNWVEMHLRDNGNGFALDICFEAIKQEIDIAFVFLASGDRAIVDFEKEIHPNHFDRYRGEQKSVCIHSGEDQLTIKAGFAHEMEVISLGGEKYFWGASFLIASRINTGDKCLNWNIN